MKKILFTILTLLLLTGCEVTYNLDLDNMKEVTSARSINSEMYNVYNTKPIPLSKYVSIPSETDSKDDSAEYYNVKDISDSNYYGLELTGVFKNVSIADSSILSYGVGNVDISDDNKFSVNISKPIKLFNQFSDLDKIVLNIKCSGESIKNNADEVNGDVYTWIITRDNYLLKKVEAEFVKNSSSQFFDNPMIRFAILIIIIVIISVSTYVFISLRKKKVNSV